MTIPFRYFLPATAFGILAAATFTVAAEARPGTGARAGGSARSMQVRGTSVSSVNWSNRSTTTVNRNVHRDANVDVNHHVDVDHHYDYDWGDHYHPVARAATTAAVTAAVVGSYYRYLPPNCVTTYRGTIVYYQCGTYWYQPVYAGTSVQYVVVKAP